MTTNRSSEPPDEDLEALRPHCDEFYRERSISSDSGTRLAALAAVNEHREQFVAWANEGVSFHDLHITIPSIETGADTSDPQSASSDRLHATGAWDEWIAFFLTRSRRRQQMGRNGFGSCSIGETSTLASLRDAACEERHTT